MTSRRVVPFLAPAETLDGFDQIVIQRALPRMPGWLTANEGLPAISPFYMDPPIEVETGSQLDLDGKPLQFVLHRGAKITVTFPSGLRTLAQLKAVIEAETPFVKAFVKGGRFFLYTELRGVHASLQVLPGDAATLLRLSTDEVWGKDAHIRKQAGESRYVFIDPEWTESTRYTYVGRSSASGALSEPSSLFDARLLPSITLRGYLDLKDGAGLPVANRLASLLPQDVVLTGSPFYTTNDGLDRRTDNDGRVIFEMQRGATYQLVVSGSRLVRSIKTDDTTPSFFNLLDPLYSRDEDPFAVQQLPEEGIYIKRSL